MDRVRSTVVAVAVLLTTAIAAPAAVGSVTAQEQPRQIDECTTIGESGTYELNGSIGGANESNATDESNATNESDATNETADGETDNGTQTSEMSSNVSVEMETGAVDDDLNRSACLAVEASDVTLDGDGYTLDGSNASELNLSGNESTATPNETDGETMMGANDSAADANESAANGIVIRPATDTDTISNVTIRNVTVQNWYVGLYVQNAEGVTLENVTLQNNTVPGFRLDNSTGLSVENVQESSN